MSIPCVDRKTLDWLLAGDPAIRWQVERDLLHLPEKRWGATRALVTREGWGAGIMRRFDPRLMWGVQDPHTYYESPDGSSLMMLQLLMQLGALSRDPQVAEIVRTIAESVRHYADGRPFFEGETEACINGRLVAIGVYFGQDMAPLVRQLLMERLPDGGWNCEAPQSQRSSVDSTICVLEGLRAFAGVHGMSELLAADLQSGEKYLMDRRLMYRLSTGQMILSDLADTCFPWFYRYDILRALCYFSHTGAMAPAFREAVEVLRGKQRPNGRWALGDSFPPSGRNLTSLEPVGEDNRWITLMGARVLAWAEENRAEGA